MCDYSERTCWEVTGDMFRTWDIIQRCGKCGVSAKSWVFPLEYKMSNTGPIPSCEHKECIDFYGTHNESCKCYACFKCKFDVLEETKQENGKTVLKFCVTLPPSRNAKNARKTVEEEEEKEERECFMIEKRNENVILCQLCNRFLSYIVLPSVAIRNRPFETACDHPECKKFDKGGYIKCYECFKEEFEVLDEVAEGMYDIRLQFIPKRKNPPKSANKI